MRADRTPVVAGVGATRFARRSPATEQALALAAIARALRDAGLVPADVDGVVRFDRDALWEFDLTAGSGVRDLAWYGAVPWGAGSAPALLRLAGIAIATGLAEVVLAYHSRNPSCTGAGPGIFGDRRGRSPAGLDVADPVHAAALVVRHHLDAHRIPERALAEATVRLRRPAARNPRALARAPIGRRDHRRSPYVAEPIRRADCGVGGAGAVCLVVTSAHRARDLRRRPVRVLGSTQVVRTDAFHPGRAAAFRRARRALFGPAGLSPADVDVACLYDAPSALLLLGLEDWGLCGAGESGDFLLGGRRRPVLAPHGGQLAEATLDGANDLVEAVRQLRGDAANPVRNARVALVAGSPLEPTSAVLLGA